MSEGRRLGPEVSESRAACVGGQAPGAGVWEEADSARWVCAPRVPTPPLCLRGALALGLCPRLPSSDWVFPLSGRWEALWPKPQPPRGRIPRSSRRAAFPHQDPRGAGLTRARARPVPGGGLEPFQDSNGFSLLDFEMTIYHYN